jgi:HK97 gp10 family phage protein
VKEFDGLDAFASHLALMQVAVKARVHAGLESALVVIEKDAKDQIGHYQPEVGEFPAWAPLAASTEAAKARLGAPANAPLLRHGGLYASIGHEAQGDEGAVGSTDPTMVFHEFGTSKMAPRPVFGPAAIKSQAKVEAILGHALVEGLMGGQVLPGGKAYFGGDV